MIDETSNIWYIWFMLLISIWNFTFVWLLLRSIMDALILNLLITVGSCILRGGTYENIPCESEQL